MSEEHILLSLPILVLDEIMKNLSPLDYLNLARVDRDLFKFVFNYPKKYIRCDGGYDGRIEGWNGDTSRTSYLRIYHDKLPDKVKESYRKRANTIKNFSQFEEHIFDDDSTWEQNQKRYDADRMILLNNATMTSLDSSPELLDLDIRTTHIYPFGDNVDVVLEQIRRFGASVLHFPVYQEYSYSEDEWRKFLGHETICNLKYLHMNLSQEFITFIKNFTAPIMEIWHDKSDDISLLIKTVAEMIEEWMNERRKISVLKFRLPITHRDIPNEISGDLEDPLNEKYNLIAGRLAENHPGGFENSNVDARFKLIRRSDGKGLFIFSGLVSLCVIECDYALRRRIALAEEVKVEKDVDAKVLQRELNINQMFYKKRIDDNLSTFLHHLMMMNTTWPDEPYVPYQPPQQPPPSNPTERIVRSESIPDDLDLTGLFD